MFKKITRSRTGAGNDSIHDDRMLFGIRRKLFF